MSKNIKLIIIFIISFVIAYLVFGYLKSTFFAGIHWSEGATFRDKFQEYYIRTFLINIIPSFIIALISLIVAAIKISRS